MIEFAERAIEAMGDRTIAELVEAAARVRDVEEDRSPELPWHLMTGMRNALIHRYFETTEAKVHATVKDDLPILITQLRTIVGDP